MLEPSLLDGVQNTVLSESFDGGDLLALGLADWQGT